MRIVKVRRVGNSNVVSLPRELEASGYTPGRTVLVEELGERRVADHPHRPGSRAHSHCWAPRRRRARRGAEDSRRARFHSRRASKSIARRWNTRRPRTSPFISELADALELYTGIIRVPSAQAVDQLRNRGGLESALARPQTYAQYQDADLALQAAVLAHGIAESQTVFDGNKRSSRCSPFSRSTANT